MSIFTALILTFNKFNGVLAAPLQAGTSYYVTKSGNDSNPCTEIAPCKTITRGINVAQNGDTVNVGEGVYNEYVFVDKSITLNSTDATIDGNQAVGQVRDGLLSVISDNVKVSGFTIINAANYGLANFGNYNIFANNIIHNTNGPGIWMRDGKFNTFENNELYYTVLQNSVSFDGTSYTCSPTNVNWPSAINPWGMAGSNIWRGNYIHDNCGEGIVTYTGDLVENNTFKNNWSVEIYITADRTTIRNNTILNTKPYTPQGSDQSWRNIPSGIAIGDETICLTDNNNINGNNITGTRWGISFYRYITCSGVKNSVIENNVINNTWEYGIRILTGAHTNSVIRNNTVKLISAKPLSIQNSSGFSVTNNMFSSGVDIFEWDGKAYNFGNWSVLAPGNYWWTATTSTTVPTQETTMLSPTLTPTVEPTTTAALATPTQIINTPTIPPTQASLTPTQIVSSPSASPIPASPTTLPISPTPQEPTQPPVSGTKYDDQDSVFVYSSGWQDISDLKAYNGSYKKSFKRNAYVTMSFTGQTFSILYTSGVNFRGMEIYVDDVLVGTLNQKSSQTGYQQSWTYPGQLTPGTHTLKLVSKNKGETYTSLDGVVIK